MTLKILVAALALAAVGLPAATFAADAPKGTVAQPAPRAHKPTCFDAPWQSQEWKDCEAKMQAQGKK